MIEIGLAFFILALLAALFGMRTVSGVAMDMGKTLIVVAIIIAFIGLVFR